ncbi:hypothetical protein DMA11_11665 [Marinilabiliaceae bacterium JC017]|nr:hypothetical protein DMA11_11665 [Marinilabiliaceae bacterium JC017]
MNLTELLVVSVQGLECCLFMLVWGGWFYQGDIAFVLGCDRMSFRINWILGFSVFNWDNVPIKLFLKN